MQAINPITESSNLQTNNSTKVSIAFLDLLDQLCQTKDIPELSEYKEISIEFLKYIRANIFPASEENSIEIEEDDLNTLYNILSNNNLLNEEQHHISRRAIGDQIELRSQKKQFKIETQEAQEVSEWYAQALKSSLNVKQVPCSDKVIGGFISALEQKRLAIRTFDDKGFHAVKDVKNLPAHSAAGVVGLAQILDNAFYLDPSGKKKSLTTEFKALFSNSIEKTKLSSSSFVILPSRLFRVEFNARFGIGMALMPQEDMERYHHYTSKEFIQNNPALKPLIEEIKNTITRVSYFQNFDVGSKFRPDANKVLPSRKGGGPEQAKDNAQRYQGDEIFERIVRISEHNEALIKYRTSSMEGILFLLPIKDPTTLIALSQEIPKTYSLIRYFNDEIETHILNLGALLKDIDVDQIISKKVGSQKTNKEHLA